MQSAKTPTASPSHSPHGLTFMQWGCCDLCLLHKPTELAHSFLFYSCVCFSLYGPFNCISSHKFSKQLSAFLLCSSGLISALLILSTMYLFKEVSISPDIIHCGWLGLQHQLSNSLSQTCTHTQKHIHTPEWNTYDMQTDRQAGRQIKTHLDNYTHYIQCRWCTRQVGIQWYKLHLSHPQSQSCFDSSHRKQEQPPVSWLLLNKQIIVYGW